MFILNRLLKRQLYRLLSLFSVVLLVAISACNQPVANSEGVNESVAVSGAIPTEFKIGYQLTAGPEVLAKSLNMVETEFPDVAIEWLAFDSGPSINEAIASGEIDVGLVGSVPVSTAVADDLPLQVYFIINVIGDSEALAVTETSGIAGIEDLPGKTIAVPFGSTSHFSLLSAIKQANIDPAEIQILDMQPQDILAAWQVGDIEGAFVWQPTLSRLVDEDANILLTSGELAETGIITADLGVVNKTFAAQYPDFIASYVNVLDSAVQLYREDPAAASEAISTEIALSPEESLALMDGLIWLSAEEQSSEKYMGTPDAPGALSQVLKDSADFLVEQERIKAAPKLKTYEDALFNQVLVDADS